jgi:hypothetical protein
MVKKRKQKTAIDKVMDALDTVEQITGNLKGMTNDIKDMLGVGDDEVLKLREQYLDNEILRLQEELYGTRRAASQVPLPCPNCGGPHKSYECNQDRTTKPAPIPKQTMTIERAVTILGLSEDVMNKSPRHVLIFLRERYRELAFIWHPDVGGSEAKMKELNAAYFFLKDIAERRAKSRSGDDASSSR